MYGKLIYFQFTGLVGVSMIFDIIYLARNSQNWFIKLITIFILIIKVRLANHGVKYKY